MSNVARVAGTILALGTAFIPFLASAQRAGDMTIGVMAGVNYATVEQDPDPTDIELDHRLGLLAGGFLDVRINEVFSIEPEVLYSQKGAEVEGTGSNSELDGSVKLDYIEVPLLLKFWVPVSNSGFRPFLFAGPAIGFEVNCTLEGEILSVTGSDDCDDTSLVKTKSTDFGGTIGGGIEFRAGMQAVRVDARYTHGFTGHQRFRRRQRNQKPGFRSDGWVGVPVPKISRSYRWAGLFLIRLTEVRAAASRPRQRYSHLEETRATFPGEWHTR